MSEIQVSNESESADAPFDLLVVELTIESELEGWIGYWGSIDVLDEWGGYYHIGDFWGDVEITTGTNSVLHYIDGGYMSLLAYFGGRRITVDANYWDEGMELYHRSFVIYLLIHLNTILIVLQLQNGLMIGWK